MTDNEFKESHKITTNIDKVKLALKDYKNKKDIGKDLFSSIIALVSFVITVISSDFNVFLGISTVTLTFIAWSIISALCIYIFYLFIILVVISVKRNNSVEWFVDTLLGNEEKYIFDFESILSASAQTIASVFYWIWKSIGYMLLILFYTFPLAILTIIGFSIGWAKIFHFGENGDSYAYLYMFVGGFSTFAYYSFISNIFDIDVHGAVRGFFEMIFDIDAPY